MVSDEPRPEQDPVEGSPDAVDRELERGQVSHTQGEPLAAEPGERQEGETSAPGQEDRRQDPVEGDPETVDRELGRSGGS